MRRKTILLLAVLLLIEALSFRHLETDKIEVSRCRVQDPELSRALAGARVVQISDLHVKRRGPRERNLSRAVERIDPDIILVTGDSIADDRGIGPAAGLLGDLGRGRTVIAILGNNDHSAGKEYRDTARLVSSLKKAGVHVLVNESVKLTVTRPGRPGGGVVYVVGVDDPFLWRDNHFTAMRNVPADAPRILLAHSPNIIEKVDTPRVRLILSGHTHGGQVVFPFIGPLYLNPTFRSRKRFVSGLYRDDTLLYVNRGIGTVVLPFRLFCKPEVTLFEFTE